MKNVKYLANCCLWVIFYLCILFGINALIIFGFQALWNWLAPVFWKSAPILTFWQSLGVIIVIYIVKMLLSNDSKN